MKQVKIKKIALIMVAFYFIYLFFGMLLPFVEYREVNENFQNEFSIEIFYGDHESNDRAAIIEDNVTALEERLRMIHRAQEKIILSTFDMREGESFRDLAAMLFDAADRGVEVQILVDGVSGLIRMEPNNAFQALSSYPNIEIRVYNTPNLLKPWTFNGRMHDKYLIADDMCYLLGGRNTFDYFLGDYETNNRSYDREVLVYHNLHESKFKGDSSIYQLQEYFNQVWNSDYVAVFHDDEKLQQRKEVKQFVADSRVRLTKIKKEKPQLFNSAYSYKDNTVPTNKVTLIHNPIHIYGKEPTVWFQLQKLMADAKEKVLFHTPYVVMANDMYQGMKEISEQVPDFSMVINSVDNGDNFVASSDYLIHKKKVLDTGVNLYEFDGGESTHGKSIVIDHDLSIVGSYNLDLRSTYVDTELMLVIHSPELTSILEKNMEIFQKDTRKVIDEKNYKIPDHLTVQKSPLLKKILWKITGPLLQIVRCLI